jgi:hypothetical protein
MLAFSLLVCSILYKGGFASTSSRIEDNGIKIPFFFSQSHSSVLAVFRFAKSRNILAISSLSIHQQTTKDLAAFACWAAITVLTASLPGGLVSSMRLYLGRTNPGLDLRIVLGKC